MPRLPSFIAVLLVASALPALGALCEKCKDHSYTKDIGSCTECGGMTSSGAFKLCLSCSGKLQQCEHCRASPKTSDDKESALAIDWERGGTYRSGRWEYVYAISNEGTRSQGYFGTLSFDGTPVAEPTQINDFHDTPWGPLYWVGRPVVAFGPHGWMPKPLVREKSGQRLPEPEDQAAEGEPLAQS